MIAHTCILGVVVGQDTWWWLAMCVCGSVSGIAGLMHMAEAQKQVLVGLNGFWWVKKNPGGSKCC